MRRLGNKLSRWGRRRESWGFRCSMGKVHRVATNLGYLQKQLYDGWRSRRLGLETRGELIQR